MKIKSTKRALLMSGLALLLCMSMLVGSTFAWFTDSATSANNKIVAGTLDVDLLKGTAADTYTSIADEDAAIFDDTVIWEPGKTQIVYLAVANNGNLDLKYNIALNVIDGGLIGALEYAIVDGAKFGDITATSWAELKANAQTGEVAAGTTVAAPNGAIKANEDMEFFALAVHMKEEAGDMYQGKGITIDVTVLATQLASENDSFGDDYDLDAELPMYIASADALQAALAAGGEVSLDSDIIVDGESFTIPVGVEATLNLNGHDITIDRAIDASVGTSAPTFVVQGSLTVEGEGDVVLTTNIVNNTNVTAPIFRNEGKLTINGGNYLANDASAPVTGAMIIVSIVDTCLYQGEAVTTINGGTYSVAGRAGNLFRNFPTHNANVSAKLIINDGTFNKNPDKEVSYIWNHQNNASYVTTMVFNGGTYNGVVYEDYYGQADITVTDAAIAGGLTAYSGNN